MQQDHFAFPLAEYALSGILGVWKFSTPPHHLNNNVSSPPGHLFHLLLDGTYDLTCNGREYTVRKGDVIYYHDSEEVIFCGREMSVTFYSVAFYAPGIPPLPTTSRTFRASTTMKKIFHDLYLSAQKTKSPQNSMHMYARLLDLLALCNYAGETPNYTDEHTKCWWEIEERLRTRKQFRLSVAELSALSGYSPARLARACQRATGQPPARRLREIRLAEAQGLLHYSSLNISEIARYLGYPRVHEFSREFSRYSKQSPTAFRETRGSIV